MQSMIRNSFFLLVVIAVCCACNKKFDDQQEMMAYLKDAGNGYYFEKKVNGVNYILLCKPTDLLVKQELGDNNDPIAVEKLRKKYRNHLYFILSMSKNKQELLNSVAAKKEEFGKMVNELAFEMESKVHLYTPKKDTLQMSDFIYPRMFGMSESTSIMIVYPRDEKYLKDEYVNFVIEDIGLYTGEIKFKIKTESLKREPQLRF